MLVTAQSGLQGLEQQVFSYRLASTSSIRFRRSCKLQHDIWTPPSCRRATQSSTVPAVSREGRVALAFAYDIMRSHGMFEIIEKMSPLHHAREILANPNDQTMPPLSCGLNNPTSGHMRTY